MGHNLTSQGRSKGSKYFFRKSKDPYDRSFFAPLNFSQQMCEVQSEKKSQPEKHETGCTWKIQQHTKQAFFSPSFSEIGKVRGNLFQINGQKNEPLVLPDAVGTNVSLSEKVYVPVKEYPDVSRSLEDFSKKLQLSLFSVQFRWANFGSSRHDHETARVRNWLQNHGQRKGVHEGQEKGNLQV